MRKKNFDALIEGVRQMGRVMRGEPQEHVSTTINPKTRRRTIKHFLTQSNLVKAMKDKSAIVRLSYRGWRYQRVLVLHVDGTEVIFEKLSPSGERAPSKDRTYLAIDDVFEKLRDGRVKVLANGVRLMLVEKAKRKP